MYRNRRIGTEPRTESGRRRRGNRLAARIPETTGSDIIDSKNHAAPPSRDRSRVHLQIDERVAVPEAAECGIRPTVDKVESENLIELHRAGHLPDGERDGAYLLDTHRIRPNVG